MNPKNKKRKFIQIQKKWQLELDEVIGMVVYGRCRSRKDNIWKM